MENRTAVDASFQIQLADLRSTNANLTAERRETDATISRLESIKQKQMEFIIKLEEKEVEETKEIANLKSQLAKQTAGSRRDSSIEQSNGHY